MPQPLRKRLGSAFIGTPYFLDALIEQRPKIAEGVGVCIAKAAACELQVFRLYLSLHRGSADIAYASFSAILGRGNRIKVMKAIATTAMKHPDDLDLFHAAIGMCESALQQRDKLAHWIWGYADALPEEGLLVDPKTLLQTDADLIASFEKGASRPQMADKADSVLVYNRKELDVLADELVQADAMVDLFRRHLHESDDVRKSEIRDFILDNPAAKERFNTARMRRSRA